MICCLRTHVRKQPIIALYFEFETVSKQPIIVLYFEFETVHKQPIITLYFEFENELKFYNLGPDISSGLILVQTV